MNRDILYVDHILGAVEKIDIVLKNVQKEDFAASFLVHDVVIRELEIIGEAAKRLSEEVQKELSAIPWREVIGMRNHVTHEYFSVDFEEVRRMSKPHNHRFV